MRGTHAALVGILGLSAACGGGGGGGTGATPTTPTSTGTPSTSVAATITIGSTVDPRDVRIEVGDRVRLVNNDSRAHAIRSNPHPTHGSCPPIDASGVLAPGASVVIGPFPSVITCYYHDHDNPGNTALQGDIRVGTDEPPTGPNYVRP